MYSEKIKKVLENKKNSDYNRIDCMVTNMETFGNDVYEARGKEYDTRIGCYSDTSDKLVITPEHLGYKFYYPPFNESWGGDCVERKDYEKIPQMNRDIFEIGKELSKNHNVYVVFYSLNEKGYSGTESFEIDEMPETYDDCLKTRPYDYYYDRDYNGSVLFVFGLEL